MHCPAVDGVDIPQLLRINRWWINDRIFVVNISLCASELTVARPHCRCTFHFWLKSLLWAEKLFASRNQSLFRPQWICIWNCAPSLCTVSLYFAGEFSQELRRIRQNIIPSDHFSSEWEFRIHVCCFHPTSGWNCDGICFGGATCPTTEKS